MRRSFAAPGFGVRHLMVILVFFGFLNVYAMRVNLSIAIVAMINNTALNINGTQTGARHAGPSPLVVVADRSRAADNFTICLSPLDPAVINGTDTDDVDVRDGPFVWDASTQSLVLGCFFYGYVVTQLPAGYYAQKYGGKWIFGFGILLTAFFTLLSPVAAKLNFYLLLVVRLLEGLAEGVTFPAIAAMLSEWAPPLERTRMGALISAGCTAGTILSLSVTGFICQGAGWEAVFYLFGILGLVWFIFWTCLAADSPSTHPYITEAERDLIEVSLGKRSVFTSPLRIVPDDVDPDQGELPKRSGAEKLGPRFTHVPWLAMIKSRPVYGLTIASICNAFTGYLLLMEVPTYLKQILRFNIDQVDMSNR